MMRLARRVAGFACCFGSLGGCAVNEQRDVQSYRTVLDEGDARPYPLLESKHEPLTLVESLRIANAYSEELMIAGEDYVQAIINRRRAAALFLPSITLNPTYLIEDDTTSRGDGSGIRTAGEVPLDARLAFNMVRDLAGVRAAAADVDTARALLRDVQDSLLIDVARAYYEVLRAEQSVVVLQNSLRLQEERVRNARARNRTGTVRPLDVSLSESQAAATRVTLIQAQSDVQTSRSALQFLMAGPVGDRQLSDGLESPLVVETVEIVAEHAARRRQDLLAADWSVRSAQRAVESAYGQYYPSIALNLSAFLANDTEPTDLDWTSLISISLPLFSQGLIEADVRSALSALRQARSTQALLARQVRSDVEIAHARLLTSRAKVEELQVLVAATADALTQADGLYRAGLGTNLEQLTAQNALLSSQLDLTNAELDRKVFYLDLLRASGRLHDLIGLTRSDLRPSEQAPASDGPS